jgi:hypothetical protein
MTKRKGKRKSNKKSNKREKAKKTKIQKDEKEKKRKTDIKNNKSFHSLISNTNSLCRIYLHVLILCEIWSFSTSLTYKHTTNRCLQGIC